MTFNAAQFSRPKLAWATAGAVNIVTDGNSLVIQGDGVVGVMMGAAPFSAHALTNTASNGQTIAGMAASTGDVTGAHVSGKQNILFAQEGTNSIGTGSSAASACDAMLAYLAAMKAAKVWSCIVVATTPPAWNGDSYGQSFVDDFNAKVDAYNVLLRARYREAADAIIDNRAPGMPFDVTRYPNYLRATFFDATEVNGYSNTQMLNDEADHLRIHYTDACRVRMAAIYAGVFRQLPRARV